MAIQLMRWRRPRSLLVELLPNCIEHIGACCIGLDWWHREGVPRIFGSIATGLIRSSFRVSDVSRVLDIGLCTVDSRAGAVDQSDGLPCGVSIGRKHAVGASIEGLPLPGSAARPMLLASWGYGFRAEAMGPPKGQPAPTSAGQR